MRSVGGVTSAVKSGFDVSGSISTETVRGSYSYSGGGDDIKSEIRALKEAILGMSLVLDTGVIAGGVTEKVDQKMGGICISDKRRKFA